MKIFYCDGSTRGKNQKGADNIGGWGVVCLKETEYGIELESFDCATTEGTTNNREELKALIYCLSTINELYPDEKCIIYSDSAYVVNTVNEWIHTWAANAWKNSKKQTVENLDLIKIIYDLLNKSFFGYDVRKCDGHSGEIGNELADALATGSFKRFVSLCDAYNIHIPDSDYDWLVLGAGQDRLI